METITQSQLMKIALLDLNHITRGIHTNTVPLGIGLISTYLKKNIKYEFDIKMFKDARKALEVLKLWLPDVLGLAQYSWNSELNLYVAKVIKQLNPACIVVAGGPNLSLSSSQREAFLKEHKCVDICIAFDGEIPFTEIIKRLTSGESNKKICEDPVAGSYSINPETGKLVESLDIIPRLGSLDAFGAVYEDKVFDEMLNYGFHPFVQTHRGCPFSCSFCHTSDKYYSQMLFLSLDIFKKDMEYLGKRFAGDPNVTLYMANTNMGLFKEDFAVAEVIRKIQKKYNWPRLINVNSGKDPNKLLGMLSIIDFRPTIALQTLTPHVLKNIKRRNVPFDKFMAFQNAVVQKTGKQTSTELILCLPGETKETFFKTLHTVMNSGIENIVIYTLMNLKGTPLSSEESAGRYGYKIRHRVVPRQFSLIEGNKILDTEEVIVATNTMSYEDYLELRGISFAVTVFFSSAELVLLKKFMAERNIDVAQWVFNIHSRMKEVPHLYGVYREFLQETERELFPTREALIEFFNIPENYQALSSGKLGDNLLRKYKCIILTNYYKQVLELAISEIQRLGGVRLNGMLRDLMEYLSTRDIKQYFIDNSISEVRYFHLNYDIQNWFQNSNGKLRLEDFYGSFNYTVRITDYAKKRFDDIVEMNKDFELSLQILYRDGITKDFWPTWERQTL